MRRVIAGAKGLEFALLGRRRSLLFSREKAGYPAGRDRRHPARQHLARLTGDF